MHREIMKPLLALLVIAALAGPGLAAPRFNTQPKTGITPNSNAPEPQFLPPEAYFKPQPGHKPDGPIWDKYKHENWTQIAELKKNPFVPGGSNVVPNAAARARKLRSVGYFPGYSYPDVPLPYDVTRRLSHIVYAFATISWVAGSYYLDFVNIEAETRTCPVGGNCWWPQGSDQCITFPNAMTCDNGNSISLAPRFGANPCQPANACWNKQDIYKSPQCNTFVQNGICGQMGYLMKKVKNAPENRGLRFLLGIGGSSDSNYWTAATEPAQIAKFVQTIVGTAITLGFDGVDIDWEYPTFERGGQPLPNMPSVYGYGEGRDCLQQPCQYPGRKQDGAKFVDLMQRLRAEFNARGRNRYNERYVLSTALPATSYYADRFDARAVCAAADFVNVMTYDYFGDWSSTTGPNSALYLGWDSANSVHGSIWMYQSRGCPRLKMNIGIPFYGRVFSNVGPGPFGFGLGARFTPTGYDTSKTYTEMMNMVQNEPGWKMYYDNSTWSRSQTQVAYNAGARKMATFDTPWSIQQKRNYALKTNVGGLMYWSLGLDDWNNSLLKAAQPDVKR